MRLPRWGPETINAKTTKPKPILTFSRRKYEKQMLKQLTESQANLIECLNFLKEKQENIVGMMLMIPQDEQIAEMAEYLSNNPKSTESDILAKAIEISK